MDSPPDMSPNEPPTGEHPMRPPAPAAQGSAPHDISTEFVGQPVHDGVSSSNDSVDSSGFEKVDPNSDLLAEYSANFAQQMAAAVYGQLPADPSADLLGLDEDAETSFEIVNANEVQTLSHSYADIDEKPVREMSAPAGEVLEKTYGDVSDSVHDVIGGLAEQDAAKAVQKAVEEAPKAVDEYLHRVDDTWEADKEKIKEELSEPLPEKPTDLFGDIAHAAHEAKDDLTDLLGGEEEKKEEVFIPSPVKEEKEVPSPGGDSGRDTVGKLLGDASDDEEPSFGGQTPEETTFERQGPLTIPADLIEAAEEEEAPLPAHAPHHHGFETEPRPPTPPKDISDEDVKPSTVQVGHGHETPHHDKHRSILKHGSTSAPSPGCCFFDIKNVDPRVLDLIYWRDPKKSGIALAGTLLVLFVFTRFPLITVLSYSGLAVLTGTVGFRLLKAAEAQLKKTEGGNPFQPYLEKELALPQDKVHEQVDVIIEHGQCLAKQLRRLFLVENIVDSVKFGLLLWSFTYIGAWFSGCTLVFLAVIAIFSVPKIYETYQEPIDAQLAVLKEHIDNITKIAEEKLPFLKRAVEAEKKEQ